MPTTKPETLQPAYPRTSQRKKLLKSAAFIDIERHILAITGSSRAKPPSWCVRRTERGR